MIVVHFESGLGNQMLNYAEYLAVLSTHPNEKIYMENIIFDIGKEQNRINMWNGYELERIFGIKIPNISELFSDLEWKEIVEEVKTSKFWDNNWDYSSVICSVLNEHGIHLSNLVITKNKQKSIKQAIITKLSNTRFGYWVKRYYAKFNPNKMIKKKSNPDQLFLEGEDNFYTGQKLLFLYKGNNIEKITQRLLKDFTFPDLEINSECGKINNQILHCNSIGVHIRRSDMLYANGYLYKFGYFKRAVKLARTKVRNPVFFIFGDTNSTDWIKENPRRIGILDNDVIIYVDCNKGNDSYRDMQLLANCKCVIITNSSFGWWGAYLNTRPNKTTISPFVNYNTTDWI